MTTVKENFNIYIKKLLTTEKTFKFLLTISGGVDSMVMADLFYQHNIPFGIAHCNFQLRANESDGDEQLVEMYANKINIPFHCRHFNTAEYAKANGLSIQMAARQLRYAWFSKLCEEHHYDFMATAHHADDQAETMLMNYIRGKSIHSLAGIPARNKNIIRPLLLVTKNEIVDYAIANKLVWREDQSNQSVDYDRNFLRLQVMPLLRELNPSLEKSFALTADLLNEAATLIDRSFDKWKSEYVKTSPKKTLVLNLQLLNIHPLKSNMLFQLLIEYNFPPAVIRQVGASLMSQPGTIFLSSTHELLFDRDTFCLIKNEVPGNTEEIWIDRHQAQLTIGASAFSFELIAPLEDIFLNRDPHITFVDAGKLNYPLLLRHWKEGDAFCPLGMQQYKKLSDFLIDEKIPVIDKGKIWLLTSHGEIVWLAGLRMDDRFKVTTATKTVLKITFAG